MVPLLGAARVAITLHTMAFFSAAYDGRQSCLSILLFYVVGTIASYSPPPLPPGMSFSKLSFTYSYPWGAPTGCCGGYYDDPSNTMFTDGVKGDTISMTNGVSFNANNGWLPLLDLGSSTCVSRIDLSYIVSTSGGKTEPSSIRFVGTNEAPPTGTTALTTYGDPSASHWIVDTTRTSAFSSVDNSGHTEGIDINYQRPVRYLKLAQVVPASANSVISEIEVYGTVCSLPPPSLPPLPPPPPPVTCATSTECPNGQTCVTGYGRRLFGAPAQNGICQTAGLNRRQRRLHNEGGTDKHHNHARSAGAGVGARAPRG